MSPNRITRGGATPRALLGALALLALLAALGGCGGSSTASDATTAAIAAPSPSAEESADAEILDTVLARQEAAINAYAATIPHLSPRLATMASYFRAQEQEHVDAVLKALRGLRSAAEPTPETIDPGEPQTERDRLLFLYQVESATIDQELGAVAGLEATGARSMLASTVANQAQHLTLLRRALGAGPLASAPVPFENGTAPPPE